MAKINKKSVAIDREKRRAQHGMNQNVKHDRYCRIMLKKLTNDDIKDLNRQIKTGNVSDKRENVTKRRSVVNSGAIVTGEISAIGVMFDQTSILLETYVE